MTSRLGTVKRPTFFLQCNEIIHFTVNWRKLHEKIKNLLVVDQKFYFCHRLLSALRFESLFSID